MIMVLKIRKKLIHSSYTNIIIIVKSNLAQKRVVLINDYYSPNTPIISLLSTLEEKRLMQSFAFEATVAFKPVLLRFSN